MKINISNKPVSSFFVVLFLLFSVAVSLSCCYSNSGHGPRSTMSDEDASAACLEEVSQLIKNSDVDGLVAAFSEKARSDDSELSAKAEKVMSLMGGGAMGDEDLYVTVGGLRYGVTYIVSSATITAPNGTKWQIHVTDCTYNKEDPSYLGLKTFEVIPYSDRDAPRGFGWHDELDQFPMGIRLITSWEGWDPYTSPYTW